MITREQMLESMKDGTPRRVLSDGFLDAMGLIEHDHPMHSNFSTMIETRFTLTFGASATYKEGGAIDARKMIAERIYRMLYNDIISEVHNLIDLAKFGQKGDVVNGLYDLRKMVAGE